MAERTRVLRWLAWGGAGLAAGVLLAVLVLNLVARTERGQQWVLRRTLMAVGEGIPNGKLEINRLSGNLFRGAKLYGVSLRGLDGEPFIVADSAFLDYDVATLVTPRILINRATIYRPRILIKKFPGDSLWNYQEIFSDTTSRDTTRPRTERLVLASRIRIVDASAEVLLPWQPDPDLAPAARRRAVREALADTAPLLLDSVPGGYVRTLRFTDLNGGFRSIQFAPGSESGSRIVIDSLRATAQIFREPGEIKALQGQLALMRRHIEFDAPLLRLAGTRVATSGVVRFDTASGDPLYDLMVRADTIAFRDLRWLYPRFPADAHGSLSLLVESRPEGTMVLARDAHVRAPGTRLDGSFGLVMGDTLQFVEVDLRAEPLRVQFIEQMLPGGLPVRGLRLGGVEIRGSGGA
ncbi:MAG TPA: hypothetical protein VFX98_16445 [Longimicrobiaceae bacterium]|nr:hypothetical protein [Longimicrobiaceae bacterium]